jgi:hypothetical protein
MSQTEKHRRKAKRRQAVGLAQMMAATERLGLYDAQLKALELPDDEPSRCTSGKVHGPRGNAG